MEIAADYLVMASWLTYLKSRLLIPTEKEDENISRQDLLKLSGGYTVPQIFINNQCIGGYDDLIKLHQDNQLMGLINE